MSEQPEKKFSLPADDDDDSDEDDADYVPGAGEDSDVSNSASDSNDDDDQLEEEDKVAKKRKISNEEEQSPLNKHVKTGDVELTSEEEEKRKQELWERLNSKNGDNSERTNVKDNKKEEQQAEKLQPTAAPSRPIVPVVRKATGVSNLLAKLGKKKESTLARSKSDWEQFKRQEGIAEELTEHTKSKGSFVERQEFLQRSDHRQFEQEKSVRDKIRSRQLP